MRVLILSCNTGEGHNSCARALRETFEAHGVPCEIADSLRFISETASKFISNWHVRIYRHLPWLFKDGYKGVENHASPFQKDSAIYQYLTSGSERLYDFVRENRFDCVVCTHIFAALALSDMVETHSLPLKTAFVATDYTCSPGTADANLQYYFIPDASLTEEFAACGVPASRIVASGLPAKSAFYLRGDQSEARRSLGIPEAHQHLLLMCGSMGCGPMLSLAQQLAKRLSDTQDLTVICGSNGKLYEKMQQEYGACANIHIERSVANMPLYMRSADLYLTKPGGLSTTEAAAAGLPMVLINTVAGCEEHNLNFFVRRGGAITAETPQELALAALALLRDPQKLEEMSRALTPDLTSTPAERIYHTLSEQ